MINYGKFMSTGGQKVKTGSGIIKLTQVPMNWMDIIFFMGFIMI